ncbi:MAG: glycoside hydrolase family 2 [Anaerolineae bacterium]|nr:glycoside hydrolase family 2 [Anaerolineae bacterium]
MDPILLDGDWCLYWYPEAERRLTHPADLSAAGLRPVPARVPGNVELDLVRAGLLPEPFLAANIRQLRPLEFCEWWYVRDFALPEAPAESGWELVLAGVDTIATVWVNGIEVGHAANMLIEHRFDVSSAVRWGETNQIAVRLRSAVNHARRFHYDACTSGAEARAESLFVRKAPHMWGWDIMPRAVSAGLWRSVWLEPRPATAIEQLYYWTVEAGPEEAVLGVHVQFRTDAPSTDGFSLRFHGQCGDHAFDFEWPCEFTAEQFRIVVPRARLWWPKGYGEPNLYTVSAQLLQGCRVIDERAERIGLRRVVVDRTERVGLARSPAVAGPGTARVDVAPDPESHFLVYVNGEPIMIKGCNWVPLDAFHSRDSERLERALALLDDSGCNMVRCWGGNVYEDHRFFEFCDERGILVWQDLAFACARYPQTEEFFAQVRAEVEAVASKLRNHASLALWCGDNEIDTVYVHEGLSPEHNRLSREVIPQVLHGCDPYRHYVPSSPYVPPSIGLASNVWVVTPEQHLWGPRGYFKSPFYTHHSAHFIGEIGYHGCPNVSSIRRFISPENLWPWEHNDEWLVHSVYHWQHHTHDRDRIKLMANQVRELFGSIPRDLETFALASQIVQAEADKFFVESTRLRKWSTSGILWWNLLDGWPQFSDAAVDYYFGKKLAYYYLRRVQHPVCVIVGGPGPDKYLPVIICNDSRQPARVQYCIRDAQSEEGVVVEGTFTVPANQNWQVDRIRTYASDQRLYLITWEVDGEAFGNHYLAGHPPFSLEQYRGWLTAIAALPMSFDAAAIAH